MTRDQLEHAIRAACDVSGDTELWVFGSQAILGEFPEAPESLHTSIEVNVQPKNRPERTDDIEGSLGELSLFYIGLELPWTIWQVINHKQIDALPS